MSGDPNDKTFQDVARRLSEQAAGEVNGLRRAAGDAAPALTREALQKLHGRVWDSFTLARDFDVEAFNDCHTVTVTRRSDGVRGTVTYQYDPRFYWGFRAA